MQKTFINNFKEKWEQLGDEFEVIETYALSTMKNLQGFFFSFFFIKKNNY